MIRRIIRMQFTGPVHFGEGLLESSGYSICADTLFSAICHEVLLTEGEAGLQALIGETENGLFRISDAFPFIGNECCIPKPAIAVRGRTESESADSTVKKQFKKLRYLPAPALQTYLRGELSAEQCAEYNRAIQSIGTAFLQTNVKAAENPEQDSEPYYVGGFQFTPDCGLWFLLCAENDTLMKRYLSVITSLGYSGIGGKRTSGFGRFRAGSDDLPDALSDLLSAEQSDRLMTLSVCLPLDAELEQAAQNAGYMLIRRSGFAASETYAANPQKKNDLYMFAAGSCFAAPFSGGLYDVSVNGRHPVYRYGFPLFIHV